MVGSDKQLRFNHDLLIHSDDLAVARELYPSLIDALHDPELIVYFNAFNDEAESAKRKNRKLGSWAILLGALAIAVAASEVAIRVYGTGGVQTRNLPSAEVAVLLSVGGIAACCGLVSVVLAASGLSFGRRKQEWLINRFMGERIRQFHFQSLLAQMPLLLATADETGGEARAKAPEGEGQNKLAPKERQRARQAYLDDRHRRLIEFKAEHEVVQREARFGVAIGPDGESDWQLCEPQGTFAVADGESLRTFFKAYRQLRLQYQADFANYKLKGDYKVLSDLPRRQSQLLADVNKLGVQLVIAVHLLVLGIVLVAAFGWICGFWPTPHWAAVITPIFFFTIMLLAVVSLGVHAFAEGLQPERETERYQQYGSAVKALLADFDAAEEPREKIRIMWQTERTAYIEMRNFLTTHHERSNFLM